VDGKRFAASHYDNIAAQLARSGQFDVVCYGHNHHYQVELQGETLMINPGTLMGYDPTSGEDIPATFVLYDTASGHVERREI
jgi:predicted phosphodiesterase